MFTLITAAALAVLSMWMPLGVTLPSILMGVGIAIDVTLATVGKFRDESLGYKNWTIPIMLTHIIFPAFGYYSFWGLSQKYPELNLVFGLTGFILVVLFLYEVVCEWVDAKPIFGLSAFIGGLFGFKEEDARLGVAIMAVSWDALWSGPAKAAQALDGNWSDLEVGISFLIAGVVVALVAQLALRWALLLRSRDFHDAEDMNRHSLRGKYVETSVIGGFGVLSLFQGINFDGNLWFALFVSAVTMGLVFRIFREQLSKVGLDEAKEAIKGEDAVGGDEVAAASC